MQTIPVETLPHTTVPSIRVGDSVIGEEAIAGEMQFHPSTDREAAAKAGYTVADALGYDYVAVEELL